jgi:hypothetical protein
MKGIILWSLILLAGTWLEAQESGYSPEKWAHIENRWLESQPVIIAYTRSGETLSGQQIHASSDSIYILQNKGLPIGPDWQKDLASVHVDEIVHILFQQGGNKMGRKKHAATLRFPASNAAYSEPHVMLRNASVYVDSLYNPLMMEEAFTHSDLLRRAYRKKRFRYSFGVNFGGDVLTQEIREALGNSGLPQSYESYGGNVNGELLDFSFRFFDRLIVGASIISRISHANMYGNAGNEQRHIDYDYHVDYRENRIYAEYAILNTDRYFSRKFEVIAGAGLLLARPEWRLGYSYYEYENPDFNYDPYQYYSFQENLLGMQVKGAIHYYFFPGLSLWTALDVNLNQPFVVPQQELPTGEDQDPFILPEHELGFSCVRFKLGLSLYL